MEISPALRFVEMKDGVSVGMREKPIPTAFPYSEQSEESLSI